MTRSYIVHVPPAATKPAALVLNFHGGASNARAHKQYVRMDELADREGFIVAYPNGTGPLETRFLTWNAGTCCGPAVDNKVDDVGFVAALLDDLAARTDIDPKHVYATGFSNGAMMAYRLAAELPGRIAAIAPVAGAMVLAGPIGHPVPVLHIHSVDDPRAIYAGGYGPSFPLGLGKRVLHPPVAETLARWSAANGCKGEPQPIDSLWTSTDRVRQTAVRLVYPGCAAPLEHWKLTGAGHVWPGGKREELSSFLGPATELIDANLVMWRFFSRVPH